MSRPYLQVGVFKLQGYLCIIFFDVFAHELTLRLLTKPRGSKNNNEN